MKFILKTIVDKIGIIKFDNDEKRNSLSKEMLMEIESAIDDFSNDDIRVIILMSNPDAKVWCAGLNIKDLPDPGKDPLPYNHPFESLLRKIENSKAPVIAMITGTVWGGGFDLAITCDMIIGSPHCSFAITPARIGVPYNTSGLIHFLNTLEMNIVKEMFFTATPLTAKRAYDIGLLNHLIEKADIEKTTLDIAHTIAQNSPLSISVIKQQLNMLGKAKPITAEMMEQIVALRTKAYTSYDYQEGKNSFLEKRKPVFKGY